MAIPWFSKPCPPEGPRAGDAPRRLAMRATLIPATTLATLVTLAQGASASSLREPVCLAREVVSAGFTWPAPLDRTVSFHASDISLKDALDRLAAQARFRISYSGEFVPLDREVCLAVDS